MRRWRLKLKQTMEMYSSTACKEALSAKTKVVTFHHQLHEKFERSSLSLNSILHLNMDSIGSGRNLTEDINVSQLKISTSPKITPAKCGHQI
jgi:hypothetical protein